MYLEGTTGSKRSLCSSQNVVTVLTHDKTVSVRHWITIHTFERRPLSLFSISQFDQNQALFKTTHIYIYFYKTIKIASFILTFQLERSYDCSILTTENSVIDFNSAIGATRSLCHGSLDRSLNRARRGQAGASILDAGSK